MDLKQLSYFLCVSREGNMTRAARQLNIVQPALSMQIAKLERSLGKRLFDRAPHGMTLTPAGEALAKLAESITREVERANEEMAHFDGKVSGRVCIGIIASVAQSTLAASSTRVAQRYPEIQLQISEGYTDTLIEWVVTGQLDAAIINMPRRRIPLTAHHIVDEKMTFAHSPASRSGFPRKVPLKLLNELDVVIPSRRHGLRTILDDAASDAGFVLRPRMEVDTLSAICEIVATTDMVSILPSISLYPLLHHGKICGKNVVRPAISRTVQWVTNPRRARTAAVAAVIEIIAGHLKAAADAAADLIA